MYGADEINIIRCIELERLQAGNNVLESLPYEIGE